MVELCAETLKYKDKITIRSLAKLLGKFSSSFISVPLGKLHYRALDRHKTKALKMSRGKFDKFTSIPLEAINDVLWWQGNILRSSSPILRVNPQYIITTDASSYGWGASREGNNTGGLFTLD